MKTFKTYLREKKIPRIETIFGSRNSVSEAYTDINSLKDISKPGRISAENNDLHKNNSIRKDISKQEKDALTRYSTFSSVLNDQLWNNKDTSDPYVDSRTAPLDSAIDKHKTTEDTTVYTGLKKSPAEHFGEGNSSVVQHAGYLSTSTSPHWARKFAIPLENKDSAVPGVSPDRKVKHILKLDLPKDSSGLSMKSISDYKPENEFLLPRNHHIEINHTPTVLPRPSHFAEDEPDTAIWHGKIVNKE
jgi:hypothetical protein